MHTKNDCLKCVLVIHGMYGNYCGSSAWNDWTTGRPLRTFPRTPRFKPALAKKATYRPTKCSKPATGRRSTILPSDKKTLDWLPGAKLKIGSLLTNLDDGQCLKIVTEGKPLKRSR